MSSGFLSTGNYELKVRQQPKYARVAIGKEKGTGESTIPMPLTRKQGRLTPDRPETDRPSSHCPAESHFEAGPQQQLPSEPLPHPHSQTHQPQG